MFLWGVAGVRFRKYVAPINYQLRHSFETIFLNIQFVLVYSIIYPKWMEVIE